MSGIHHYAQNINKIAMKSSQKEKCSQIEFGDGRRRVEGRGGAEAGGVESQSRRVGNRLLGRTNGEGSLVQNHVLLKEKGIN